MAKKRSDSGVVRAPERLTVEHAADLRAALEKHAAAHETTRVDLGAVTGVDTAGLQLLVVVSRSLRAGGKVCGFDQVPDCVADGARLLGVDGLLELE